MTLPPPAAPAPGWYPDPQGGGLRYWDGGSWTRHRAVAERRGQRTPHPTLPFPVAVGALVALAVPVVSSRFLLQALAEFRWPIAVYVAIAGLVGYGPSVVWCVYASRRWGSGSFRADMGVSARWSDAGWGPLTWLACLLTQVLVALVVLVADVPFRSNTEGIDDLTDDRGYVLSLLVLAVVAAPIVEEVVFRGAVLRGLLSVTGPVTAVGVQAVLFGAAHVDPVRGAGNIGLVLVLTGVGATLGGAAYLFRRIAPTMIAHAILNAVALTIVLTGWGQ